MEGTFAGYMTDKGFLKWTVMMRPECQSRKVGVVSKAQQPDCKYHLTAASTLTRISVTFKRLIKIPRVLGKERRLEAMSQMERPLPQPFHFRVLEM